jgi:2-methylcitrate dehydratase PrpD
MSMTISEQLARHFASLDYDRIPAKHTADARQLVLDYLGVAIAGSQTESARAPDDCRHSTGYIRPQRCLRGSEADVLSAATLLRT